jgi:hypothetical protein
MLTESVYLGHDNTIDLILRADDIAIPTSSITKITLLIGDTLLSSTNQVTDHIRWNQSGYVVGEVRLQLGHEDLVAGKYPRCYLTVYDIVNTEGIVWGALNLYIASDVEVPE